MSTTAINQSWGSWPGDNSASRFGSSSSDGSIVDQFEQLEQELGQNGDDGGNASNLLQALVSGNTDTASSEQASGASSGGVHGHHGHHGHHSHDQTDTGGSSSSTSSSTAQLTVGSDGSIDTGAYTISPSVNDDGSMTIKNKQTGETDEIWGDPHINANGTQVANFQNNNLDITLPDGTLVNLQRTPANSTGETHISQATISKGGSSVVVNATDPTVGLSSGSTTSGVMYTGRDGGAAGLATATDDNIAIDTNGNIYTQGANGSISQLQTDSSGNPINLDTLDNAGSSSTDGSITDSSSDAALLAELEQYQQLESEFPSLFGGSSSTSIFSQDDDSSSDSLLQSTGSDLWD